MWNKVILFVPDGADSILSTFEYNILLENMEIKQSAFELHAIDAFVRAVLDHSHGLFYRLKKEIDETLSYFKMGSLISIEIQENMRGFKNELSLLLTQLTLSRDVLEELSEDDEDMALMNLSILKENPKLYQ
jgi:hypothetical protein